MKTDVSTWIDHESLAFSDSYFELINLNDCVARPNSNNYDFNTELVFTNCTIDTFSVPARMVGKKISFHKCRIGNLMCSWSYFFEGVQIHDCTVLGETSFNAGVHNQAPNRFEILRSTFEGYVDFFDVYFKGPVVISKNDFKGGTNLGIYLKVPFGIDEGIPCLVEDNLGDLSKYADDDPMRPKH